MEVKPIKQAQQRLFDFYRLFMDHYTLQIEASIWEDEPENRLNIITKLTACATSCTPYACFMVRRLPQFAFANFAMTVKF